MCVISGVCVFVCVSMHSWHVCVCVYMMLVINVFTQVREFIQHVCFSRLLFGNAGAHQHCWTNLCAFCFVLLSLPLRRLIRSERYGCDFQNSNAWNPHTYSHPYTLALKAQYKHTRANRSRCLFLVGPMPIGQSARRETQMRTSWTSELNCWRTTSAFRLASLFSVGFSTLTLCRSLLRFVIYNTKLKQVPSKLALFGPVGRCWFVSRCSGAIF